MGRVALIGLGSNVGDRKSHLDTAVARLAAAPGIEVRVVSSYHETKPVGGPEGQGAFLNAAAALETILEPESLLRALQVIELRAGRIRSERWGARTLDLDLLLFGDDEFHRSPVLDVPHPWLCFRRFVLAPLSEIAADFREPVTRCTIAALLANLDRRPSYVAICDPFDRFGERLYGELVSVLGAVGIGRAVETELREFPHSRIGSPLAPTFIAARIEQIRGALNWESRPDSFSSERWVVSGYWLEACCYYGEQLLTGKESDELPASKATIRSEALRPTFVVADPLTTPFPIQGSPVLAVDSADPAATLARVLTACAATRPA